MGEPAGSVQRLSDALNEVIRERDSLREQLEAAQTQLHAEQRDRNWWAANNSRERQQLRERSEMLEQALRRAQAIARRGVGPDTTPEQALETIDGYIERRLEKVTVTKSANPPITKERPRDAGTSGATT